MKTILSILAVLCLCQSAKADTNSAPSVTTPSKIQQVGSSLWNFFKDSEPFYGTNQTIRFEAGALTSGNKWGAVADVVVMVDSQLSIGFATAYFDSTIYTASLSIQTGTTWDVPVIGKVYTYIESGPGWNLQKDEPIAQSFAGAVWKHDFSPTWHLFVGGAVGNVSDRAESLIAMGLGVQHGF